ncbi:hypothetical protein K0M31_004891 [Melipona bicolor]|uniref:Uncharacterized protein n=1 Tax=Melipona bicolor TaxID=60889 RepID=A0AA40FW93_9HYME|nr:hypothetical protein K0M31_004891 [Melipona bicolor]
MHNLGRLETLEKYHPVGRANERLEPGSCRSDPTVDAVCRNIGNVNTVSARGRNAIARSSWHSLFPWLP